MTPAPISPRLRRRRLIAGVLVLTVAFAALATVALAGPLADQPGSGTDTTTAPATTSTDTTATATTSTDTTASPTGTTDTTTTDATVPDPAPRTTPNSFGNAGASVSPLSAATGAPLTSGFGSARRQPKQTASASPVSVTMNINGIDTVCGCVNNTIGLTASTTAPAGQTITGVDYQISPADQNAWTTIATGTAPPSFTQFFDTTTENSDDYDFRAVATDSAGDTGTSSVIRDLVIANGAVVVTVKAPALLHGTSVTVTSTAQESGGVNPSQVDFQWSPAGTENWTTFKTVTDTSGSPPASESTKLDTTKLPDGPVDLRVVASDDFGDPFVGRPVRNLLIDNTPPTSSVTVPAAPLSGMVTLTASAGDGSGSGVSSVAFQEAPAGSGQWSTIGIDSSPPFTDTFDSRALSDGTYDFRVVATDVATNSAPSAPVSGVAIANPGKTAYGSFVVTNFVVPATNVSLLGEVGGSPVHETWAYGYTTAPPASVGGTPLPYTAGAGNAQLVLLRYTDPTGWQIADVLRSADGSGFPLVPGRVPKVSGMMTASGDGWIVLRQALASGGNQVAVFHKPPASHQFLLDPSATATLAPLLTRDESDTPGINVPAVSSAPGQVELGQSPDGSTYGLLVAPEQPYLTQPGVHAAAGGTVSVQTELRYGVLQNGQWSVAQAQLPNGFTARGAGEEISLMAADPTGPGTLWGALSSNRSQPLMLGRFDGSQWTFSATGFDALDLTGPFATVPPAANYATGLRADGTGVWLSAVVHGIGAGDGSLVAHYDTAARRMSGVWCSSALLSASGACTLPLDANHPAAIPQGVLQTADGSIGEALSNGFVDVYSYGTWNPVAAPGFLGGPGKALFVSPTDGWIVGPNAIGRISAQPQPAPLASWPEANRATLLSVALPPAGVGIGTPGALAVGLEGAALHYDPTAGWLVDPTPPKAEHVALRGVAYDGPGRAVAVGDLGTILDWDGSRWSADPQSNSLTVGQLNAVAFAADGEGWAVGTFGTILHWDGTAWTSESIDPIDAGESVTSVAVAGSDVLAIAGGNLIERSPSGAWSRVSALPSPAPAQGSLRLVSGLPDGGAAVGGSSVLMTRSSAGAPWRHADQPITGTAVALSAYRDPGSGTVQAFASLAPTTASTTSGGFPSGDGELVRESPNGIEDLSRAQYPGTLTGGEGAVVPDPALAVAAAPDGSAAWAVGGYAGTVTADGLGTLAPLQARPQSWQTASIWRFDAGGSKQSTAQSPALLSLPAQPNTVSFAFFSSPVCRSECASAVDAQPDVNLSSAASEIASFAGQPGGPAFAVLGGNAVGPSDATARASGFGAIDLANLHRYLSPLGRVPLYAAYGPLDSVPSSPNPMTPWSDAFGGSPAPFGTGAAPAGINPVASGGASGSVHRYYAFDAAQNGGTLRVIVLDNAGGSLEASDPGQSAWLDSQLAAAKSASTPVIAVTADPLDGSTAGGASDGPALADKLASAGVLAVFTANGDQVDRALTITTKDGPLPEYQGASLGYQQDANSGVLWYEVAVDTAARKVSVEAIPVIQSLALEPLAGLTVPRSSTLDFRAIGRRPPGSLATKAFTSLPFTAGIDNYVAIPATPKCTGCVAPSYTFKSSDPTIGDFVQPSAPGSLIPALDSSGQPIPSSQSGLFCGYNAGSTTVSITSGQLTASQPVTVSAGGIGRPCGTVYRPGVQQVVTVQQQREIATQAPPPSSSGPATLPPQAAAIQPHIKAIVPPPPPPTVAPVPAPPAKPVVHVPPLPPPAPVPIPAPFINQSVVSPVLSATIVPPVAPPATPIPPGGATAPSAAKREEKARKEASQSAYSIRPSGVSAADWFYPALGGSALMAVILAAIGLGRIAPERSLAMLWDPADPRYRRRDWKR